MNKKYLAFSFIALFAVGLVAAAVVDYWGQTEVEVTILNSFISEEVSCELTATAGDGQYTLCPFYATNNLDRPLNVDFRLNVEYFDDQSWNNLEDDAGVYVGMSEDLQYALDPTYNPGDLDDLVWMMENLDWFDWDVLTQVYPGAYNTTVINGVGRTGYTPLDGGSLDILDQTIPAGYDLAAVIYVGSGLNLESGDYRVTLKAVNVSEVALS